MQTKSQAITMLARFINRNFENREHDGFKYYSDPAQDLQAQRQNCSFSPRYIRCSAGHHAYQVIANLSTQVLQNEGQPDSIVEQVLENQDGPVECRVLSYRIGKTDPGSSSSEG
jgi:hypothetical protein